MIVERAPAKINLALHVTGVRDDGYHELESLVAFADFGDVVTVAPATRETLRLTGPFAQDLDPGSDNLVNRARALMPGPFWNGPLRAGNSGPEHEGASACAIVLEKNLPVASGIGGGSADAAATLRALNKAGGMTIAPARLREISAGLGADIPMCIASRAALVSGIGDRIKPLERFPSLPALLVNPMTELSTRAVFEGLASKRNPGLPPVPAGGFSLSSLIEYLAACRNDLEAPARLRTRGIGEVLRVLRSDGNCLIARMSGSGATCFALFPSHEAAAKAGKRMKREQPGWWIQPCRIEDDPYRCGDPAPMV